MIRVKSHIMLPRITGSVIMQRGYIHLNEFVWSDEDFKFDTRIKDCAPKSTIPA